MPCRSFSFFVVEFCVASVLGACAAPIDQVLRKPLAAAVRWQAYWEGVEALGGEYRPGVQIEVRVLRTQTHVYAFLAPLLMMVDITASAPDFRVQKVGIRGSADRTNAEAVASFLRMQGQTASGCSGEIQQDPRSSVKNRNGKLLPVGRLCLGQEALLSDETFWLPLPELAPPDSIQAKSLPSDKDALIDQVRHYLVSSSESCGVTTARISFFSDLDPHVYVFLESAGDCARGIATYSRTPDGRWEFGKFFADVPKEGLSSVIAKVKANTAITVKP